MDTFFDALAIVSRWDVIAALLAGSVGGVIIGAIPGVGPAVAIAILLPATFGMEPIVGLTLLLGIYGSALFGGSIPSILINTPGTPVNALTTYDGFPMTKQGQAPRALGLSFGASFFGGIFAVIALVLLAPVLARVAPMFGSREIFLAALLGCVLVVVAHRGQALAAGALLMFGLFLNTIGMEANNYTRRFTFDLTFLDQGVNLIVVVLGLFAVSQAFVLLVGKDDMEAAPEITGNVAGGVLEVLRHKRVASVGSLSGTIMGIIPGVGEFTSQFLSYSYARASSKNPGLFGKGSPEGLVASESANNSVPPAAMVPLLALGIPGEALTAMMLSVFYVHNVIPGPTLFRDHMDFVMALYICLALLNILALAFLLVATKPLLKVLVIPNRYLGMIILTLSFVGIYSLRNSAVDCMAAAAFGLLGVMLKRLNLPIVPIILGMVLGGIMENKFRTSLPRIRSLYSWIDRPVAMVIFILICIVLALHLWGLWRDWKEKRLGSVQH
ncbi:MAG: tripartite tricarboxylate transporter permease [Rhodobacteraceae bacterium]|nr:tripartite tricarboxylate transporter permease [Paracoccaceae bacterium]